MMGQTSTAGLILRGVDHGLLLALTILFYLAPVAAAAWLAYSRPFVPEIDVFVAAFVAAVPLLLTADR